MKNFFEEGKKILEKVDINKIAKEAGSKAGELKNKINDAAKNTTIPGLNNEKPNQNSFTKNYIEKIKKFRANSADNSYFNQFKNFNPVNSIKRSIYKKIFFLFGVITCFWIAKTYLRSKITGEGSSESAYIGELKTQNKLLVEQNSKLLELLKNK